MTTTPDPTHPSEPAYPSAALRAHSFNGAAAQYADNRPSYPTPLFEAVEELSGRPLKGARAVDVGAGTGISTAQLDTRGAKVLAVEPGTGMAAEFRRRNPHIPLVRGNGNELPLRTGSADLLTYAQAWHWTDTTRSVPEAIRVLRPGGALALWWNADALELDWISAQSDRIARFFDLDMAAEKRKPAARIEHADPSGRLDFRLREIRWSRRVPLDTHLANIGSHSGFLVAPEARRAAFLETERDQLLRIFPDGVVEETYDVFLALATTP
ncbi:class I SAM-dependent methyltransferase [Streptomyces sp. J2-1]|uniref:class I SAM-dependent methyltransferase n=1 Tax=Streptomyces corallincola TaxID=2851888 RepID=UPI001C38DABD|nr:class I SAM-dependent methyltransferase [Streptomyces corallincola]MBV2354588.1 class I SAM-dependent methyltransferase [Streptomyces corallincola]